MKTESKACAYCGDIFNSDKKGMTPKVWAKTLCCSQSCGAFYRHTKAESQNITHIDTGTAFFAFLSGRSMMEIQAQIEA